SLFKKPAIEAHITEAESRLNTQLPEDYKTFLCISNGFGAAWGHPLGDYQPPLHPVSSLRWLQDCEDYFTELSLDIPAPWHHWPFAPAPKTQTSYGEEHFTVGRALEIGTEGIDNTWLVPPSTVSPIKEQVRDMLASGELGQREKESVSCAVGGFAGSI
ncbi:hypothetical protein EJ02DRAFT_450015, partial [Clathrospora elynae]